ncbi:MULTISPECIES: bifunctional glycosyltransferase family 2 protein/CDP-glycerol:glycerophosphate glycerophosphotransferase [unclassified Streptomyces]|uniref:bifunctional glycosyltransferase/CDP-glycerol:glycerophosphate glycerophosphotransferase n=1 Tax=unclassified Streptomyces TaxID=2593676 RepID=UPI002476AFFF|nr:MULTISPECIES: bifunctional glycosyltransferase family 2 protein/CDP-glycerol:glycerophosphate glycerophosphotransferase [unclassified Streptomyces]MDH6450599.1 CDP-glycerol glycerophosphotransferase (TagB/SpsB family)/glycosyltransferase involved in cell wall biosynthesis [Streptomyces sp. SAI-119]MDH6498856.1 CDP-glycerol glycerophosphotransferase (TagB/SpsB family)/glycosyltransferase involved in cell wall biosynthesis [Streptomyces sp. SAI-149]
MPRFSVIVPAYKVQAYLPGCLESVLSQSYEDLELIAVDDRSPDACGEIVDEFAARDPRVRAVHLARNTGLGPARNAGTAVATGDYLLFLDGDDTLAPHALRAIADRLKETGEPDVLVHDHALAHWSGETVRDAFAGQLTEQGPAPFRLEDRPGLLRVPPVAWNKAYRREFVERGGFAFPPGQHPDLPWTYPVLTTAESIATLDRVCVHHRRRRQTETAAAAGHFDLFDQYDRVFAHTDAHPELAQWRPLLFRLMVDHLSAVFTDRALLPRGSRAEFLKRARDHCRAHRTPGHSVPARSRLRHTVIRLGLYRTQRLAELAQGLGRGTARPLVRLAKALHATALRLHYRVQLRLPLRADRAVFAAHGGRGHGCNPGALEEAFRTFAPHIRTAWIARPEHHHTIPTATARLRPGTAAYWTALARSKYLVANDGFDRRLVKRPGQILVQTQHGTPLKHMGLDLQERPAAARDLDFDAMLRDVDRWDYLLSPNRHTTLTWERVYPGGYTTLPYGQPRNDVFQRATSEDVRRLRELLGIPEGSVAILYAPTYRDYRRTQHTTLDLDRLVRRLGPRFVVLARAHHRHGGPLVSPASGRVIDVTGHPSVESLCLASDALVTDYSSLMFDYANLDRPIVIHSDDREAYEAARGTYFDLRSFAPGAIARSEDELTDIFATGHWRGSRSTQLRSAFRERFCPYDDGRAAERVVRHVVLGETELPPVIPPADRHPVPSAAAALERPPLTSVPRPATDTPVPETL